MSLSVSLIKHVFATRGNTVLMFCDMSHVPHFRENWEAYSGALKSCKSILLSDFKRYIQVFKRAFSPKFGTAICFWMRSNWNRIKYHNWNHMFSVMLNINCFPDTGEWRSWTLEHDFIIALMVTILRSCHIIISNIKRLWLLLTCFPYNCHWKITTRRLWNLGCSYSQSNISYRHISSIHNDQHHQYSGYSQPRPRPLYRAFVLYFAPLLCHFRAGITHLIRSVACKRASPLFPRNIYEHSRRCLPLVVSLLKRFDCGSFSVQIRSQVQPSDCWICGMVDLRWEEAWWG
jgi:hypothetical protein